MAVSIEVLPDPMRWVVAHARPRCEKKLAAAAGRMGCVVYLPVQTKVHRYARRERRFESPLFSGYLFCQGDAAQRQWVRQNQYCANLLEVVDQAGLVAQLRHLQQALSSGLQLEVMPYLESGRRVRVTSGPLRGFEGLVVRVQGRTRVLLNIDMIRQSAAVEMDSALLAPL